MRGRDYVATFHASTASTASPVSKHLDAELKSSFHTPPTLQTWLIGSTGDFSCDTHSIRASYGCLSFIAITVASQYSKRVSLPEAKLLLSSASIAATNTSCSVPIFVQLLDSNQSLFLGYSVGDGACTRYDSAALTHVPPTFSHLSGLIELFKSKIGPNALHAKIIVSARFEYTLAMWREELKESTSSVDAILLRPVVSPLSYRDPIKALHLSTLWPQFREDAVSDNAVFSELDPMTAPTWTLRMEVEPQRPKGALGMV